MSEATKPADCGGNCESCGADCSSRQQDMHIPLNQYSTVRKVIGIVSGFQSTPPVWAETAKETIFSSLKHLYYNIFYRKKQENSM